MVGTFRKEKRSRATGKHLWRRSTYNEIEKVVAKCRFLRHLPVNENQEYRQEGTGKGLTQKARRECNPQRHRIAEFAAVVASGQKGYAVQKACRKGTAEKDFPQRHRITRNAAVVASGQKGNAVQKACRKGTAEKGFPQRHRIAEFAAVVASRQLLGLFEVLRGAEDGVDRPVDAHAVSVDH